MPYGVNQYLCIITLTEQKFLDTYITLGSLRIRSLNNTWCLTYTSTVNILFDISESLMGKFRILSRFRCHAGNTSWPLLYCTYLNILLQSTAMTETYHYLWLYESHRDSRNIEAFGIYSSEGVNQILWGFVWDVCTLQFQATVAQDFIMCFQSNWVMCPFGVTTKEWDAGHSCNLHTCQVNGNSQMSRYDKQAFSK